MRLCVFLFMFLPVSLCGRNFCEYADKISVYIQDSIDVEGINNFFVYPYSAKICNGLVEHRIKEENECCNDTIECDLNNCTLNLYNYSITEMSSDSCSKSELWFGDVYKISEYSSLCMAILTFSCRHYMLYVLFLFDDRNGDLNMSCIYKYLKV